MARDDFKIAIKQTLANRVGLRCSLCDRPTSGPSEDAGKAVNVGVAAHITAASPGGPRYDPSLGAEQRRSAENGIWCCQTCGKLVDSDPQRYTVEHIRRKKDAAELRRREEIESVTLRSTVDCSTSSTLSTSIALHEFLKLANLAPQLVAATEAIEAEAQTSTDIAINDAFQYIPSGKPDVCFELLEKLRKTKWQDLSRRHKYRILANQGNARCVEGRFEDAARLYLQAREYSDSVDAMVLEARAHCFRSEFDRAQTVVHEVLTEEPENAHALAVQVQIAQKPYHVIVAGIPAHLLQNAEVAVALSRVALEAGEHAAAVNHARVARQADPDWPVSVLNLAAALLATSVASGVVTADGELIAQDTDTIREAESLLTDLLEVKPSLIAGERGMAHYNRSTARRLLGNAIGGAEDLEQAYLLAPGNRQVIATYALKLQRLGNAGEAIVRLRKATEVPIQNNDVGCELLLAQILLSEGGQIDEALGLLERIRVNVQRCGRELRFEYAKILCAVSQKYVGNESSESERVTKGFHDILPAESIGVLDSCWLLERGKPDEAREVAEGVVHHASDSLLAVEAETLAQVLIQCNSPEKAATVVEKFVNDRIWTKATALYIESCDRSGHHNRLLRICSALRANGCFNRTILCVETRVLVKYERRVAAINLINQWLDENPNDVEAWLLIGELSIVENDERLTSDVLKHLPEPERLDADLILRATHFVGQCRGATSVGALSYAYRVWRSHRSDDRSWRALISAAIFPRDVEEAKSDAPAQACEGVAVKLAIPNEEASFVCLVSHSPDPMWFECGPDDPRFQALMGKRVGDNVELPAAYMARMATIEALLPAERFAATLCLDRWEEHFPNQAVLQRFQAPDPAMMSPEDVQQALQPIVKLSADRRSAVEGALDAYRSDYKVSTWMLASATGSSHFEVLECIAESVDLPVRCGGRGQLRSGKEASDLPTSEVVLDTSAVCTLSRLDLLGQISSRVKLVVPQRLLDDVAGFTESSMKSRTAGYLSEQDGKLVLQKGGDRSSGSLRTRLVEARKVLETQVEVMEGMALARLQPETRDCLEQCFGHADARAVAIAQENGWLLMSDEAVVSSLAQSEFGIDVICTSSLLEALRKSGHLDSAICVTAIVKLHSWGYPGAPVSPQVIVEAFRAAEWDCNRSPAPQVLSAFSLPSNEAVGVVRLAVATARSFWREVPLSKQPRELLVPILERIRKREDHELIIRAMVALSDQAFGVDVLAAQEFKRVISSWIKEIPLW